MVSSASNAAAAPWGDLLPEVCDLVIDRLDAIGVMRFPAVCSSWAAVSRNARPRLPSGAPALLTSAVDPAADGGYDDIEYDVSAGTFGLHGVATGASFRGEAEGLKVRTWIGGKDDWLVTTDLRCGVELLNPVTGARVPLPSFATVPGVRISDHHDLHVVLMKDKHSQYYLQQVALCRTPAHPDGYLAAALFFAYPSDFLAVTAAGDERWTALKTPPVQHDYLQYSDVSVHKGRVLAVVPSGNIYSWDMEDLSADPTMVPGPGIHIRDDLERGFLLVPSSGGHLQVLCVYGYYFAKDPRWIVFTRQWSCLYSPGVSLHELDAGDGTWRRVRDLGDDRALFLGASYPFYATVPRGGSKDLRANCVYVADVAGSDAAVFDLDLPDDYEYGFERRLSYATVGHALQMPMWFRPTAHTL